MYEEVLSELKGGKTNVVLDGTRGRRKGDNYLITHYYPVPLYCLKSMSELVGTKVRKDKKTNPPSYVLRIPIIGCSASEGTCDLSRDRREMVVRVYIKDNYRWVGETNISIPMEHADKPDVVLNVNKLKLDGRAERTLRKLEITVERIRPRLGLV